MNILVNVGNKKLNFTADPKRVDWRIVNGIPQRVTSEYNGYTGPKLFNFPTDPGLDISAYPDITEQYQELLKTILKTAKNNTGNNKVINFFRKCILLGKNFKACDPWDTKFLENFPGRSKDGKVQYSILRGKIVNANFVSNCLYAEALSGLSFKKWFAKLAAQVDACGISNLIFEKKIPTLANFKFKDTKFDQDVIESVFNKVAKNIK